MNGTKLIALFALAACLGVWRTEVAAQVTEEAFVALAPKVAKNLGSAGGGAALNEAVSAPDQVQVEAARGSSAATIKLTRQLSVSGCARGASSAAFNSASLLFSAPLNKDGDDSAILDLDGLTNAASVELQVGRTLLYGCRNPFATEKGKQLEKQLCDAAFDAKEKKEGKPITDRSQCDGQLTQEFLSKAEYLDWQRLYFDDRPLRALVFGATAKLGRQDFEYVEASTATKTKQGEAPWSVGAFVAWVPDSGAAVYALRARYQRTWKDAKAGAACSLPAAGATTLTCATGPVGEPSAATKKLLSLEARWDIMGRGIGVGLTRDFQSKVYAVELPLYLIKDKDGKASGGVKIGWRSDSKDIGASVFVGVPFDLP